MKATHKVCNSDGQIVGYLINNSFCSKKTVTTNIKSIENIKLRKDKLVCKKELPVVTLKQLNEQRLTELQRTAPFKRDVANHIMKWKKCFSDRPSKLALFVWGMRQVGKTTELLKFAYSNYEYVIYVNLMKQSDLMLFNECISYPENIIIMGLRRFCEERNLPEYVDSDKTILVVDEVQRSPTLYGALRTLLSCLNCNVAVTGSYLGATLHPEYFQPAGSVYNLTMTPLSFKEFCSVFGKENLLLNLRIDGTSSVSDYRTLTDLYEKYIQIGGFPAVVHDYTIHKDVALCHTLLAELLRLFNKESEVYFTDQRESFVMQTIYSAAILEQLREKRGSNKNISDILVSFIKGDEKTPISRDNVNKAMAWLVRNGVLNTCLFAPNGDLDYAVPGHRFYFSDVGLATYLANMVGAVKSNVVGLLAETFVYNELYRKFLGWEKVYDREYPAFGVYNQYELDFIVRTHQSKRRYGIEVKSNHASKATSLEEFFKAGLVDVGIVAEKKNGGHGNKYDTIPIYTVGTHLPYER